MYHISLTLQLCMVCYVTHMRPVGNVLTNTSNISILPIMLVWLHDAMNNV